MNTEQPEGEGLVFSEAPDTAPDLPFEPVICGSKRADSDIPRSTKPHIAIVTMKVDIRTLNPDGTMGIHVMGRKALEKYGISDKAQFIIKGTSEAGCIKKLIDSLENMNND